MSIIVKIGSESLKDFNESMKVHKLVQEIAEKIRKGTRILLVTSGAVQFGRDIRPDVTDKHVLAGIGWGPLTESYRKKFSQRRIPIATYLATHADIEDDSSRANRFRKTIENSWGNGVLPIVNENDALSTEEMQALGRGADNDKNAFLLAKLFQAKLLVYITNTNGVWQNPEDPTTRMASISPLKLTDFFIAKTCHGKSTAGTGGMASKLTIAREAAKIGIHTHIGDGIASGVRDQSSGGTNIFPQV